LARAPFQTLLGSLQRSPSSLARFKGPTSKGRGRGEGEGNGKGRGDVRFLPEPPLRQP